MNEVRFLRAEKTNRSKKRSEESSCVNGMSVVLHKTKRANVLKKLFKKRTEDYNLQHFIKQLRLRTKQFNWAAQLSESVKLIHS